MRRIPQALAVTVVFALLALLVWDLAHTSAGRVAAVVDSGKTILAPTFTRPRIDTTGMLSLAALRGKVVVLNFWQSYCQPCQAEARTFAAASKRWAGKNVVFVGVDELDLRNAALKFMKRFGITYATITDDGPLVGHYGVTGYPETFIVDKRGLVVPPHIVGPATPSVLDKAIKGALAT